MLDNTKGYDIKFIQKASPKESGDAFDFAYIYKFFSTKTDSQQSLKYIIRAENHDNVFAIKFYAARDKKLDTKYSRVVNANSIINTLNIFKTCAQIIPLLSKDFPTHSFIIKGQSGFDTFNNRIEDDCNNQRYRIYRNLAKYFITNNKFEHFIFEEISTYLLVNKHCNNVIDEKNKIKDMFISRYDILDPID